jgi:hypothetical protein
MSVKFYKKKTRNAPLIFTGVRVTRSLVLYVCFVDRCFSFCTFSFGHCVVCSSSIYGFWLPFWYLQTLHKLTLVSNKKWWSNLIKKQKKNKKNKTKTNFSCKKQLYDFCFTCQINYCSPKGNMVDPSKYQCGFCLSIGSMLLLRINVNTYVKSNVHPNNFRQVDTNNMKSKKISPKVFVFEFDCPTSIKNLFDTVSTDSCPRVTGNKTHTLVLLFISVTKVKAQHFNIT